MDTTDGHVLPWDAQLTSEVGGFKVEEVAALAVNGNSVVIARGLRGSEHGLFALNISDGQLQEGWQPFGSGQIEGTNWNDDGQPGALGLTNSGLLLVGSGGSNYASGPARVSFAAFAGATPPPATDTTPPQPPSNLEAKPIAEGIQLTWSPSESTDVNYYAIYRENDSGNWPSAPIATPSGQSYVDTVNSSGTYRVTAIDLDGNESTPSSSASGSIGCPGQGGPASRQGCPLPTPTGLAAAVVPGGVKLSWQPVMDLYGTDYYSRVSGYAVYRDGVEAGGVGLGATTLTVGRPAAGQTVVYQVASYDPNGDKSVKSAAVTVTIPPACAGCYNPCPKGTSWSNSLKRCTGQSASARCIVPRLAGKSLAQAKRALKRAHCRLGRVHRSKRPKGSRHRKEVVRSQSPKAGSHKTVGAKVALWLV